LQGVAQGRVRYERFWALPATVGGEAVLGVTVRRFGDHTGPRIEDERCAIGPRPVGGKERIKRLPCHALDRDLQIDRRCLGLFIKSDHATASGIGEGAHATAASFAGKCRCRRIAPRYEEIARVAGGL